MHLPNNSKQKHSDLQRDRLPYIEKRDRSDTTTDALHNNGQPLSIVELYGNIYYSIEYNSCYISEYI